MRRLVCLWALVSALIAGPARAGVTSLGVADPDHSNPAVGTLSWPQPLKGPRSHSGAGLFERMAAVRSTGDATFTIANTAPSPLGRLSVNSQVAADATQTLQYALGPRVSAIDWYAPAADAFQWKVAGTVELNYAFAPAQGVVDMSRINAYFTDRDIGDPRTSRNFMLVVAIVDPIFAADAGAVGTQAPGRVEIVAANGNSSPWRYASDAFPTGVQRYDAPYRLYIEFAERYSGSGRFTDLSPFYRGQDNTAGMDFPASHAFSASSAAYGQGTGFGSSDVSSGGAPTTSSGLPLAGPGGVSAPFGVSEFSDVAASAAPEPSTWVLMLLGFASLLLAHLRFARSRPSGR